LPPVRAAYHRLLLLFVDGIGLGGEEAANPFVSVPTPALRALLGGPLTAERVQRGDELVLVPLDACLGVPGLPQSGTGQTTLFTGVNAQALLGRHVPALPGPRLRALIAEHGLLAALVADGHAVTFANAYTAAFAERLRSGEVRASATTCAVLAARLPLRLLPELAAGRAVTWDVTGEQFAQRAGEGATVVSAERAGANLAALAAEHRFTLYETFLTDLAGHGRWGITAESAIARLDGLLAGALAARPPDVTLLLTSDHGNLEEPHRRHTTNPVPLLAVGPAAAAFADLTRLDEVAPLVRTLLSA
jgi:2,3-bisphosphoglycerate-independent phosphoglycerate mutase